MQSKELVEQLLDTIVAMAEHCKYRDNVDDDNKCIGCCLSWNFNIRSHGCFLVENGDTNSKMMEDLESVCIQHNIDYLDKFDRIYSIFESHV